MTCSVCRALCAGCASNQHRHHLIGPIINVLTSQPRHHPLVACSVLEERSAIQAQLQAQLGLEDDLVPQMETSQKLVVNMNHELALRCALVG
jgi:hypothetical protein